MKMILRHSKLFEGYVVYLGEDPIWASNGRPLSRKGDLRAKWEDLDEFLSSYSVPSEYRVILPTPTQTILDNPPGYIGLYTHYFSLANLRLLLIDFFCELFLKENMFDVKSFKDKLPSGIEQNQQFQRLARYLVSAHSFNDPILFLAGLQSSWEHGQQNFIYTEDEEDLTFLPKDFSPGFNTGSPSVSINTEPVRADEKPAVESMTEPVNERMRTTTDLGGIPKEMFLLFTLGVLRPALGKRSAKQGEGFLDNHLDVDLLDLHDRCYARQAVVDNTVNRRSRELLKIIKKLRGEADVMRARELACEDEYEGLQAKCEAFMTDFDKNHVVLLLRENMSSLTAEAKEHKGNLDRREMVSKVVPYACMELLPIDELGRLVGKLVSSDITFSKCMAYKQVARMKEPFDLSKLRADASASMEAFLLKKPPLYRSILFHRQMNEGRYVDVNLASRVGISGRKSAGVSLSSLFRNTISSSPNSVAHLATLHVFSGPVSACLIGVPYLEERNGSFCPFDKKRLRAASFSLRLCISFNAQDCSNLVIALIFEVLAFMPCLLVLGLERFSIDRDGSRNSYHVCMCPCEDVCIGSHQISVITTGILSLRKTKGVTEPKGFGKRLVEFGLAYAGMFRNVDGKCPPYGRLAKLSLIDGFPVRVCGGKPMGCPLTKLADHNRDGECRFDYLTSALVSSKAHREGCRASHPIWASNGRPSSRRGGYIITHHLRLCCVMYYGRKKIRFTVVARMKEPFDLSKVKRYHSSHEKEHTQAISDFATAIFSWLNEFVADASASVEALISKKPPTLQKPIPSRTQMHVPSSQLATPSSSPALNHMPPPADIARMALSCVQTYCATFKARSASYSMGSINISPAPAPSELEAPKSAGVSLSSLFRNTISCSPNSVAHLATLHVFSGPVSACLIGVPVRTIIITVKKGMDISAPFDKKRLRAASFSLRLCISFNAQGCSNLVIALIFEGLAFMPCLVIRCPKNGPSSTPNEHFFAFSFMLIEQNLLKVSYMSLNIPSLETKGVTEPKGFGKRLVEFGLAYAGMFRNVDGKCPPYGRLAKLPLIDGFPVRVCGGKPMGCPLTKLAGLHFDFHSLLVLLPKAFHLRCSFRPCFPLCFEFLKPDYYFPSSTDPRDAARSGGVTALAGLGLGFISLSSLQSLLKYSNSVRRSLLRICLRRSLRDSKVS
nr:hypothetical protein [Tanacetum cinerariifolium]